MTSYSGLTIDEPWYETLQGNILKPHGRNHHRLVLLTFKNADLKGQARDWIRGLPITSFSKQLDEARKYRAGQKTDVFISFLLSASGYQALGYSEDRLPNDPSFQIGMKQSIARSGELSLDQWDDAHRLQIDAVLALADDDLERLVHETERLISEAREVLSHVLCSELMRESHVEIPKVLPENPSVFVTV
jgi:deferrochelatase/peroxidase EfeB